MPIDTTAIACPEYDLLMAESAVDSDGTVCCPRCGVHLYRQRRNGLETTLALACAALVLLGMANVFPIVGLDINGQRIDTSVFGAANRLWQEGMQPVATVVLFTTTVVPLAELATVIWLVLPLRLGKQPPAFARLFGSCSWRIRGAWWRCSSSAF